MIHPTALKPRLFRNAVGSKHFIAHDLAISQDQAALVPDASAHRAVAVTLGIQPDGDKQTIPDGQAGQIDRDVRAM